MKPKRPLRYQAIIDAILTKIESGEFPPGARLPSEPELARIFSVNTLTVRQALAHLQKNGRISRQQGRGTFVRAPSDRPTSILFVGDIEGHGYRECFNAIRAGAQAHGFHLSGFAPSDEESTQKNDLLDHLLREADAAIVACECYSQFEPVLQKADTRVITVGYWRVESTRPCAQVLFDIRQAIEIAVDHLALLGHRRIALATMTGVDNHITDGRLRGPKFGGILRDYCTGYHSALLANGVDDWQHAYGVTVDDEAHDLRVARAILEKAGERPTAFVCDIDSRARPLYAAAVALGMKIPDDLSIVGVGNTPWAEAFVPGMTSVDMGRKRMADVVLRYCVGAVPKDPIVCRIEPRLVVRQSTAKCQ